MRQVRPAAKLELRLSRPLSSSAKSVPLCVCPSRRSDVSNRFTTPPSVTDTVGSYGPAKLPDDIWAAAGRAAAATAAMRARDPTLFMDFLLFLDARWERPRPVPGGVALDSRHLMPSDPPASWDLSAIPEVNPAAQN